MKMSQKLVLTTLLTVLFFSLGWSQKYDPKFGNTFYPNGTIYLSQGGHGGYGPDGPVVIAIRADGTEETVLVNEDPDRARELLEEADDALQASQKTGEAEGGPAPQDKNGKPQTTQSLINEWNDYVDHYAQKPGAWSNYNGNWSYVSDPRRWTNQIISSIK